MPLRLSVPKEALLEREAELEALVALARQAAGGTGGVALVEGPAGIGKTALLEHAVPLIRAEGTAVAVVRGGELERDLPWGVVRDLFEIVLGRFNPSEREALFEGAAGLARSALYGSPAPPAAGGEALASALHGLYWLTAAVAEREPIVLVVDDAHWLDPSSLRFVGYLGARVRDLPVAIVAAVRSGEPEASGRVLRELGLHPWTTVLEPAPLGEEAAGEIVGVALGAATPELARACHELTAGNPFYLRELLHDLQRTTPDAADAGAVAELRPRTIAQMVQQRLTGLPEGALQLARAAALLGPRASVGTTALLADLPIEDATRASDALVAADVLRPKLPLGFVHPLVRQVVYSDTPPAERSRLH
ncbi:MAG TPA: AAA family ATPase, partial [Polyangiales bacterium]|nr:AAA family ATPase [Polyangiales bacterium]